MVMKMRKMIQWNNGQKGFTLIELIVVMAILAVLAAIAIPKYTGILQQSKYNANDNNIDLIAHAAEMYYGSNNSTVPAAIATLTSASFLKAVPSNPISGGAAYTLTASGNGVTISPGKYSGSASPTAYNYAF